MLPLRPDQRSVRIIRQESEVQLTGGVIVERRTGRVRRRILKRQDRLAGPAVEGRLRVHGDAAIAKRVGPVGHQPANLRPFEELVERPAGRVGRVVGDDDPLDGVRPSCRNRLVVRVRRDEPGRRALAVHVGRGVDGQRNLVRRTHLIERPGRDVGRKVDDGPGVHIGHFEIISRQAGRAHSVNGAGRETRATSQRVELHPVPSRETVPRARQEVSAGNAIGGREGLGRGRPAHLLDEQPPPRQRIDGRH